MVIYGFHILQTQPPWCLQSLKSLVKKKWYKALEGMYSILYSNKGIYWMPTKWLITAKQSLLSPFHWWGNWDLDSLKRLSKMIKIIINKDMH